MPKDWSRELEEVNFRCSVCRSHWSGLPDLVEPDDEAEHHPFRYFADCRYCGAKHQPQAAWERALLKAHRHATGPRTREGLASTSRNLEGHPTQEEALRTRFNAMKHGLTARTATYFPAKPNGYAHCKRCDVDRLWCAEQPACVKQTELFMLTHAAFEQRDPRILGRVHSDLHAALVGALQLCVQQALADGVVIKTPKVEYVAGEKGEPGGHVAVSYVDGEGRTHQIYDYMANPVFKPIADLVTRLGLSLADLGMTAKAADEDEAQLRGRLAGAAHATEHLQDFSQRMAAAMEKLHGVIGQARKEAAADPVLLEHQRATGIGDGGGGGGG
jgi:hypothetical protein